VCVCVCKCVCVCVFSKHDNKGVRQPRVNCAVHVHSKVLVVI
jgi:hypothetical protein